MIGFGINIANRVLGSSLFLDDYPNAAIAYSLRKLRTLYTGSAIRVRRSSDNTEQDIGFNASGGLDTSALTSFCSGTNGFVTTWYDQSGNARNATQTTAASQPQIVSSGSILTLSGVGAAKPIIRFDGVDDSMKFSSVTARQHTSIYPQKKAFGDISMWISTDTPVVGTPYTPVIYQTSGIYIANSIKTYGSAVYNNNAYILMAGYFDSSDVGNILINDSPVPIPDIFSASGSDTFNQLGLRGTSGQFSKCDVPEVILYSTNRSADLTKISNNINSYYGIY